jgi:eukaryotic-like serine/threonine-protein kinase
MTRPHWLGRTLCKPRVGMRIRAGGHEYELAGDLGDGAIGVVRKAVRVDNGRSAAIKFLAPDPKYIEESVFDDVAVRFRREGERGAGLSHENLVKVIAYEENSGGAAFTKGKLRNPFLVMEYIRGHTLESLIKRLSKQEPRLAIDTQRMSIAVSLCRALAHLHDRKIVHRDVKPANVFLSAAVPGAVPSEVKLGDFGVTKWGDFLAAASTGVLTVSHQQGLGTLKYMSPEQAVRPKEVTVRSDMYSLGITLFELFSGSILPSPHHVFDIRQARMSRTTTTGRLLAVGLPSVSNSVVTVFEPILDMFMAADSRPSSKQMVGRYEFLLERLSDHA